jgi:hypothetical protein
MIEQLTRGSAFSPPETIAFTPRNRVLHTL